MEEEEAGASRIIYRPTWFFPEEEEEEQPRPTTKPTRWPHNPPDYVTKVKPDPDNPGMILSYRTAAQSNHPHGYYPFDDEDVYVMASAEAAMNRETIRKETREFERSTKQTAAAFEQAKRNQEAVDAQKQKDYEEKMYQWRMGGQSTRKPRKPSASKATSKKIITKEPVTIKARNKHTKEIIESSKEAPLVLSD